MTIPPTGAALDPSSHTAEVETVQNSDPITTKQRGRPKNLRPWPKGVSGNPGGRPKSIFGRAALRQLRKRSEGSESKLIELIDAQIDKAIREHDTRAAEFLRDSVDGRPSAGNGDRTNIGTINIQWNGSVPAWAQLAEPVPAQDSCAIDVGKIQWAQPTTLAERVGRSDGKSSVNDGGNQSQKTPGAKNYRP